MWEGRHWEDLISSQELASSEIMTVPQENLSEESSDVRNSGVRRGMLQAMMRMMVTQEVRLRGLGFIPWYYLLSRLEFYSADGLSCAPSCGSRC